MKKSSAIVFSGNLRTYDRCFLSLKKNILDPLKKHNYTITVFLNCWPNVDSGDLGKDGDKISEMADETKLQKLYGPHVDKVVVNITETKVFTQPKRIKPHKPLSQKSNGNVLYNALKSHWYGVYLAGTFLIQDYDLVLRSRYDIMYSSPLDIESIEKQLSSDILFVGPQHQMMNKDGQRTNVNNLFAVGSVDVMRKYCDFFTHIEELWNETETNVVPDQFSFLCTRNLQNINSLFVYYLEHKCKFKIRHVNLKNTILRHDGTIVRLSP